MAVAKASSQETDNKRRLFMSYKETVGKQSRTGLFVFCVLWSLFGSVSFFASVMQISFLRDNFSIYPVVGSITQGHLCAGIVFLLGCGFASWLCNYPKLVHFMADTENEIRKVSWPNRDDLFRSTMVVLVFIVIFAGYMAGADWMILEVMNFVFKS